VADRRMLAKSIIESDAFSDMPLEAQMLYVRLNLAADDDGFVSNPRTIMRGCGAGDDSMKLLITKKFILTFQKGDNFIYLIKHWKIHNYIRMDRYKASTFRDLLREVYYDENKAYSLTPGEGKTPVLPAGIPSDNQLDTDGIPTVDPGKVRLGKSKDRVSKELGEERIEEGKEGCGEENPEPAPKPAENSSDLSEERKNRIRFWKGRIDFMKQNNYSTECMYSVALAEEGITKEDIDNFRED